TSQFRSFSRRRSIANQHKLALHRSLSEQFVRTTGLGQWNQLGNHWLDFPVTKQIEQRTQIFTKPCRFPSFQVLYAVGEDASSARGKESAERVPRRSHDAAKAVA